MLPLVPFLIFSSALLIFTVGLMVGIGRAPFALGRMSIWLRLLAVGSNAIALWGGLGFLSFMSLIVLGTGWMSPSQELPVGYASGIVTTSNGLHVVPLEFHRIQIYDANWHFLRGWNIRIIGKHYKVQIQRGDLIEVFSLDTREIYSTEGNLLKHEEFAKYPGDAEWEARNRTFNAMQGTSHWVPTPIWFWVSVNPPVVGFFLYGIGLTSLALIQRRAAIQRT